MRCSSTTLNCAFRSSAPNIQGVLFHDMGNVYQSLSDISLRFHQNNLQDFNYTVQAVGFGVRYRTPVGPVRADFAYSINPPAYVGFSGTPAQILNCNPNTPIEHCPAIARARHRASAISSSSFRSGRLSSMRGLLSLVGFSALLSAAVVLDRIAVIAGTHVIKASDIDRDLRLTDFLNRAQLDFSASAKRESAERLITQQIIRDEIVSGGYRRPPEPRSH